MPTAAWFRIFPPGCRASPVKSVLSVSRGETRGDFMPATRVYWFAFCMAAVGLLGG
jgi:hypothetical protein